MQEVADLVKIERLQSHRSGYDFLVPTHAIRRNPRQVMPVAKSFTHHDQGGGLPNVNGLADKRHGTF